MVDLPAVASTLARGILAYAAVILVVRLSGNRTLAKMRAYDLVVTIALGSLLATAVVSNTTPLWQALLGIAILVLLQWIVARVSVRSPAFNAFVTNEAIRLYEDGRYDEAAMRKARVTRDEARGAARAAGLADEAQAKEIWLEVNGDMSVVPR